ncbi:flagellar motor protein MotD [Denitrificimonas caeni]|uniref:Flagellar motor protein MotD n=1 Tax=Denitrificimonas caeni TaxID=521720 RepID=A0AAE9VMF9_9GAMM|nr:flagellar motor protein MotD [Denitrificimonas caeni]NLJ11416.1 flagellar motor protein MotD [Gammaproteobacteria bacterium]WBE24780.1 flagellar motor protein MotD [Denitrificimonas caeni]
MARRRREEEPINHDRWLVSYADFITLLFAFFVVMYSISSINEGKYKVLSDSMEGIFSQPERAIKPIPVGDERFKGQSDSDDGESGSGSVAQDPLASIAEQIRDQFDGLLGDGKLHVRANEMWLELELSSSLLFPSGDAIPHQDAFDIIEKISSILAPFDNPIQVEGFTDNLPISTAQYPTNWELSAARAASIVRMLVMDGVQPERLAAVGYGEFQPIADNADAAGRARNRRVVLVISRNADARRQTATQAAEN